MDEPSPGRADRGEEWRTAPWPINLFWLFEFDAPSDLWWRFDPTDPTALAYYVNCNDVFGWGCADVEPVEPDDVKDLAQARADVMAALDDNDRYPLDWADLWIARKRGCRPQGAVYKHIDSRVWHLFDAAGPERATGLGNPDPRPGNPS